MDRRIQKIIEEEIRPQMQRDGGDIEFVSYNAEDGIIEVRLLGMCRGCPFSQVTFHQGVEKLLKQKIPQIHEVRVIDE